MNHISCLLDSPVENLLDGIGLGFFIEPSLAGFGLWVHDHRDDLERHFEPDEDAEDANEEHAVEPVLGNRPEFFVIVFLDLRIVLLFFLFENVPASLLHFWERSLHVGILWFQE